MKYIEINNIWYRKKSIDKIEVYHDIEDDKVDDIVIKASDKYVLYLNDKEVYRSYNEKDIKKIIKKILK